jgi:hypothetical protein
MSDNITSEIYRAIYTALETTMHAIGNTISDDARQEAYKQGIRDRGDFEDNIDYDLTTSPTKMKLRFGSNVKHEQYVLGGKVPSWTPLKPLKAWVERKNLDWVDKGTGIAFTIDQMAFMIRGAIKRRGIKARNVFAEVMKNKEKWIFQQLNNIDFKLDAI